MQWVLALEMKQHETGRVWKRLLAFSASALNPRALMGMLRVSFSPGPRFASTNQQDGQEFPQQISALWPRLPQAERVEVPVSRGPRGIS